MKTNDYKIILDAVNNTLRNNTRALSQTLLAIPTESKHSSIIDFEIALNVLNDKINSVNELWNAAQMPEITS